MSTKFRSDVVMGDRYRDPLTGFEGVATGVTFYLHACERVTLEYADSMTITGREVPDELFERLRRFYDEDAIVELTATIAWDTISRRAAPSLL